MPTIYSEYGVNVVNMDNYEFCGVSVLDQLCPAIALCRKHLVALVKTVAVTGNEALAVKHKWTKSRVYGESGKKTRQRDERKRERGSKVKWEYVY